jgi:hypothetical protein
MARKILRRILWQVRRKFLFDRDYISTDVANMVISPGGVGTSLVMAHLSQFIQINDPHDQDGIKHLHRLPDAWLGRKRVLFIGGDADTIYRSILRRGWLGVQSSKLGCPLCRIPIRPLQKRLFKRAVRVQQERFEQYPTGYVLTINFDELWDRIYEIGAFFGIENDAFGRDFPPREEAVQFRRRQLADRIDQQLDLITDPSIATDLLQL